MLEAHWEPSQTSKNKISEKTVMNRKPSPVFPEAPHQTVAFGWAGIWMHPWILLSMKFFDKPGVICMSKSRETNGQLTLCRALLNAVKPSLNNACWKQI